MRILELGCGINKGRGCPYASKIVGVDVNPKSKADVMKFPEFETTKGRIFVHNQMDLYEYQKLKQKLGVEKKMKP